MVAEEHGQSLTQEKREHSLLQPPNVIFPWLTAIRVRQQTEQSTYPNTNKASPPLADFGAMAGDEAAQSPVHNPPTTAWTSADPCDAAATQPDIAAYRTQASPSPAP